MRVGRDILTGGLFAAVGAGAVLQGRTYGVGTTTHMGPGYFPVLLGAVLAVLGIAIMLRGLRSGSTVPDFRPGLRPLIAVVIAIVGFGLLIDRGGLLLAVVWLVSCACAAGPRFGTWEFLLGLGVLSAIACVIYVYGLGLPAGDLLP